MIEETCLFAFSFDDSFPRFSDVTLDVLQIGIVHHKALLIGSEGVDDCNLPTCMHIALPFMIILLPFSFILVQVFSDKQKE